MMAPRKSRRIEVVLSGGLGNQLFQYFAGLYLAKKLRLGLIVDSTFVQQHRTGHADWIDALDLPGEISPKAPSGSIRHLFALLKKFTRGLLARLVNSRKVQLEFFGQYRSDVVGYDPNLELVPRPVTVTGYFQTWRYYQALKEQNLAPELALRNPSNWFLESKMKLEDGVRVLGIHVRRGDYISNTSIGILPTSYYKNALEVILSRGESWDSVWVFSDDVALAEKELGELSLLGEKVYFVDPPQESHSVESLLLMSKTSALVIANSTFSWWAAILGRSNRTVVCPSKWFAQHQNPTDIFPPNWVQVPSGWLDAGLFD